MIDRRALLIGAGAAMLTGPAMARAPALPVAMIQVRKGARKLELLSAGRKILNSYDIRLGSNPVGPKRFQGDGRTPEGSYRIDRKNRSSAFYLSLGVSYPSRIDRSYASKHGRSAGGDIFIHGQPNGSTGTYSFDWTRGCIAVSDRDMDEIFRLIRVGIPIHIFA